MSSTRQRGGCGGQRLVAVGVGLDRTARRSSRVEMQSQINDGRRRWEGFLDLRLRQGTYGWRFVTDTGAVNDRGSGVCR